MIVAIEEKEYERMLAKNGPGVIRGDEEQNWLAGLLMKLREGRAAEEGCLVESMTMSGAGGMAHRRIWLKRGV